jgi:hypothetical protein
MSEEIDNQVDEAPASKGPKTRRKSGTGFPVVSLADAASILKEAGKYGFEHSTAAFASYMGHSTTNSGAFRQRLAALRDWKLITGRGDNVAMTEVGKMIALPTDEEAERRALRDAFHSYSAFSKLYEGSARGTPLAPRGLRNRAVHDFGVVPSRAIKFVNSFIDSAVTAGLAEVSEDGQVTLLVVDENSTDATTMVESRLPTSTPEIARRTLSARAGAPVVHQSWTIAGGTIIFEIRSNQPLPASAFVTVGEVVASLENLARTLGPDKPHVGGDAAEQVEWQP